MSELKPCPFCGGEAKLENLSLVTDRAFWVVHCSKCRVSTPCESKKERVLKIWNRRETK